MRAVTRTVRSWLVPPAPYVTETNVGSSGSRSVMVRHSTSSPSSSFGGKNSNETARSLGTQVLGEGVIEVGHASTVSSGT